MGLSSVSAVNLHAVSFGNAIKSATSQKEIQTASQNSIKELASAPTNKVLAQMSNVNFTSKYNYGKDDFSAYDDWRPAYPGDTPPLIEINKYHRSLEIQKHIDNEDYLSAIKGKLELAQITREQGKGKSTFLLEEGIRRLYKDLPKYQKEEAKAAIAEYNYDMAKYIDKDIEKL